MATEGRDPHDPSAIALLTNIHRLSVSQCSFSPETDQILTGSEDSTLGLWTLPPPNVELHDETMNVDHMLVCHRLSDHKDQILSVAIHRKLFISASRDGQVKLWKLVAYPRHPSSPTSNSSSSYLSDRQETFRGPSPESSTYNCHNKIVRTVTFSNSGRHFATGSDDQTIKIWSTECRNKMVFSLLDGHTNWIKCVRYSKINSHLLASCGDDGTICIWDIRTRVRQPPCVLMVKRHVKFNSLDWHPAFDHHIATGSQDAICSVWDLRNKKQIQIYADHKGSVNSVAFDTGGSLLLSGSHDKTAKIFDVCRGKSLFTLMSHTQPLTSVCFNTTGELFATSSRDRTVTVWKRNFESVNIIPDG